MSRDKLHTKDLSTEEKIKMAARLLFLKKGFAATKTRDIAEEAGINLALLNYYFRSKQKLFDLIMMETMKGFVQSLNAILNENQTDLFTKMEFIVSAYLDLLSREPEIPLFIISELRQGHGPQLIQQLQIKKVLMNSALYAQYQEAVTQKKIANLPFIQFLMNLLGMTVFPFIAAPILKSFADLNDDDFQKQIQIRKKMIPLWMKEILELKV